MTESISTAEGGLATTLRAAQYRMSTDPQKYSIENQAAAIAAYAARRNISIVRTYADKDLLGRLRALLRRKGRLSLQLMMTAKDVPHCTAYTKRFGSLTNAYRLAGFQPKRRYCFKEIADEIDTTLCSVADDVEADLQRHGRSVTFVRELYLLMIDRNVNVAVVMARSVGEGRLMPCRWEIRRNKCKRSDLTLVIRMDRTNTNVQDYFLLPTANLPRPKDNRVRISDRVFAPFKYESFAALMSAMHRSLSVRPSKMPAAPQAARAMLAGPH